MQATRRRVVTAVGALALGLASRARAQAPVRGVVELFTSQGCSSCPPADRLLGELALDPGLVVLSLPVTYWDRLGWKDSFGQTQFTNRQRAYARLRHDDEVYTPQAVVNGTAIAVGSDRAAILSLARSALPVRVTIVSEGGRLAALVEGAPAEATVVAAPFLRARSVAIGAGENANSRVTYTNIVQDLAELGTVGSATRFSLMDLPVDVPVQSDGIAVLVQLGGLDRPGAIVGASYA